jgi:hypothetical protein
MAGIRSIIVFHIFASLVGMAPNGLPMELGMLIDCAAAGFDESAGQAINQAKGSTNA